MQLQRQKRAISGAARRIADREAFAPRLHAGNFISRGTIGEIRARGFIIANTLLAQDIPLYPPARPAGSISPRRGCADFPHVHSCSCDRAAELALRPTEISTRACRRGGSAKSRRKKKKGSTFCANRNLDGVSASARAKLRGKLRIESGSRGSPRSRARGVYSASDQNA